MGEKIYNNFIINIWIITSVVVFGIDQLVKNLLIEGLLSGQMITDWLQIRLMFNRGIAFGMGEGWGLLISVFAFLIFVYFIFTNSAWWWGRVWTQMGVGMVLAGSFSNIVDRFRYAGGVVDYIDIKYYSVFNLADVFIFVGLCLLIWYYWKCSNFSK